MKKVIALLCLLLALRMGAIAHADGLPWIGSEKDAAAQALATGKPELLYLHADYCIWCHVMDETTFRDSRVRLLATQYVLCKLNGDREGKSYLKKFAVEKYPFQAVLDSSGALMAKAPDYMDADKYAHVLAVNLPAENIARLEAAQTSKPGDSETLALLAVLHAERGETEAAARSLAALSTLTPSPPSDLVTAANHAAGLDDIAHGNDAAAIPCLQKAAASSTDPREAVALRFLLSECWTRLHKKPEAITELETVRHFGAATKDEKKDAKKREDDLARSSAD